MSGVSIAYVPPLCVDAAETEIEMQQVLYGLVRSLKPELVVETGTYHGASAHAMGRACLENGHGRVITCDPSVKAWIWARDYGNMRTLPVDIRQCMGADVPELETADFLFLDSDYRYREEEIRRAKPGAVIVVHDAYKSYDPNIAPLAPLIEQMGGLCFRCGIEGRGFGILVKR